MEIFDKIAKLFHRRTKKGMENDVLFGLMFRKEDNWVGYEVVHFPTSVLFPHYSCDDGVYYMTDFGRDIFACVLRTDKNLRDRYVEKRKRTLVGVLKNMIEQIPDVFDNLSPYSKFCLTCDLNGLNVDDVVDYVKEIVRRTK
jgi:hypothetical protein